MIKNDLELNLKCLIFSLQTLYTNIDSFYVELFLSNIFFLVVVDTMSVQINSFNKAL